jgi:hypothetical protein
MTPNLCRNLHGYPNCDESAQVIANDPKFSDIFGFILSMSFIRKDAVGTPNGLNSSTKLLTFYLSYKVRKKTFVRSL